MKHEDYGLWIKVSGGFAIKRVCKHCSFAVTLYRRSGLGRGHGMRVGNVANAEMIQHAKEHHPEQYQEYRAKERKEKQS